MIVGIAMVRDEQDVIGDTIDHHLAHGVDRLIIADNLSEDDTRGILEKYPEVQVVEDDDPAYQQAEKMTRLAYMASEQGAEWVLPFDADELFYTDHGSLAAFFAAQTADIIEATVWDHIATDDDPPGCHPFTRIRHRRQTPQRMPKIAFRAHPDAELHMGNHDVNRPGERAAGLYARHFQYRSFEQMVHKLRVGREAYECSNLHPTYGAHWRDGGAQSDAELFRRWRALCEEPGLIEDPAPWRHR